MIYLQIFMLGSVIYFAQARSIPQQVHAFQGAYEDNLSAIIKEMADCMDSKLGPLLAQITEQDQILMKDNGYVEQLAFLARESKKDKRDSHPFDEYKDWFKQVEDDSDDSSYERDDSDTSEDSEASDESSEPDVQLVRPPFETCNNPEPKYSEESQDQGATEPEESQKNAEETEESNSESEP